MFRWLFSIEIAKTKFYFVRFFLTHPLVWSPPWWSNIWMVPKSRKMLHNSHRYVYTELEHRNVNWTAGPFKHIFLGSRLIRIKLCTDPIEFFHWLYLRWLTTFFAGKHFFIFLLLCCSSSSMLNYYFIFFIFTLTTINIVGLMLGWKWLKQIPEFVIWFK